jgi:hypothetical protein
MSPLRYRTRNRRPTPRPLLERLEDRTLPAGWPFSLGGTGQDWVVSVSVVPAGLPDAGSVYVGGGFSATVDFDPDPSGTANVTSKGLRDGYIAKYSPTGEFLWVRHFGKGSYDDVRSATLDPGGNIFLVGDFDGTTSIAGINKIGGSYVSYTTGPTLTTPKKAGRYTLVAKIDPIGNVQWAKQIGGSNGSAFATHLAIHTDASGQVDAIYATGWFSGTVDFNPDPATVYNLTIALAQHPPRGGTDAYVVKLDGAGSFRWAIRAGAPDTDKGWDIATDADGNTYVAGFFQGSNPFGPAFPLTAQSDTDGFIAKLASGSGNVSWVIRTDSWGGDLGVYQGSLYVAGYGAFISKLNTADGLSQWTTQIGIGTIHPSLTIDPSSGAVYATGSFSGNNVDFDPGPGVSSLSVGPGDGANAFVAKLNADSTFAWATRLGGPASSSVDDYSYGKAVALDASGAVFVTGSFTGSLVAGPGTTFTSKGNTDVFVAKLSGTSGVLALRATGGPASSTKAARLTDTQLKPVLAIAIDHWAAAGLDAATLAKLRGAAVVIGDLGGSDLGLAYAESNLIRIDDDAAGHGWFVDPTPGDDSEYTTPGDQGEQGRMDLLTVLTHELGHLLGYDHAEEGVMEEAILAGTRRTPAASWGFDPVVLDQLFATEPAQADLER